MATVLLKQYHLTETIVDVPITLAALTLATKYQHADAEYIDYDLLVDHFALQHSQIILVSHSTAFRCTHAHSIFAILEC